MATRSAVSIYLERQFVQSIAAPSMKETKIRAANTPILRIACQVFNTKAVEYMAATQRRIVDLAQQRISTYRARRVGNRLHATLFQRGSTSAEDMPPDPEKNIGAMLGVANDVQPFVDTNTINTRTIYILIVTLELSSTN